MKKRKSIQLFALNRNHNLRYEGICKLTIDTLSSVLIVEPEHEEHKIKSAKFECGFVMNKNVLFVIAEREMDNFVLIFDEEERCKKVYDLILGDKAQSYVNKEMLINRFLVPLSNNFTLNGGALLKLKEVVLQLIAKEEDEKEKNGHTATSNNVSDLLYASDSAALTSNIAVVEFDNNDMERSYIHRKRRHSQLDGIFNTRDNGDIPKQNAPRTFTEVVERERYQLRYVKSGKYIRRRLFIFTNAAKNQCYQYPWSPERKLFYCNGCNSAGHETTAIFDKTENGIECIKLENQKHSCSPVPYNFENCASVLTKPDYEIVRDLNAASGMILVIFAQNDRSRCWEFQEDSKSNKIFSCCKCNFSAKLVNKNTKNEYVELKDESHPCEYIPYEPTKYYHFNDLYQSTEFEIQTYTKNGKEMKRFIVFDKTDRTLCHYYSLHHNLFVCYPCADKGRHISAKLLQTPNGEEYVVVPKKKHVCKLRPYVELLKKDEIILRPPDFEYMENTENGTPKLFIFDSTDRSLCYTFSFADRSLQRYYCRGCADNKEHKGGRLFSVYLCKDGNDGYYVRFDSHSKHICQPRKYEPEKYAKKEIQKCYDYFFFRRQINPNSINLAIHHPEDKSLCFPLNFYKSTFRFVCTSCKSKGIHAFFARILKDEDGKEYFSHDYKKHVCQPVKVSSICGPEFVVLNRDEINLEEEEKKKPEIDDSKIITSEYFELCPNQKGVPNASLLIYYSDDQSIGYRYTYRAYKNYYTCYKCHICCASAKLRIQESGEIYVILGKVEHKCEPVNFMKT